jgi:tetratricopeptide (TPR) repeat protein
VVNNSHCDIDIFLGVNELADLYQLKDVRERSSVRVRRLFGQPHNVMAFLNGIKLLKPYLKAKAFDQDFDVAIHCVVDNDFTEGGYLRYGVELFYQRQDYEKALGCFESLLRIYPSINTFWKFYGICLYHVKNPLSAIEALETSTAICFSDGEAHYYLALIYFYQQDYQRASGEFTHAIDFSTEKKMTYYIKLAISLRELGEYARALKVLNASLAISRNNYGTYYQMAQVYKKKNNMAAALKNMEKAGKLNASKKIAAELQALRELHSQP